MTRSMRVRWALRFLVLAVLALAAASVLVMTLWNWLVPQLFGWPAIGLAQATGLLVLCRVLFGGFRGRGGMHWRQRMAERWSQMTPEQQERFRAGMQGRCGSRSAGGPPAEAAAS
jgi:hypothetical protein